MTMYQVTYKTCETIFDSYSQEQKKVVDISELVKLLNDNHVFVISANYYNYDLDKKEGAELVRKETKN